MVGWKAVMMIPMKGLPPTMTVPYRLDQPEGFAVGAGGIGDQQVGIAGLERFPHILHMPEDLEVLNPKAAQSIAQQMPDVRFGFEQDAVDLAQIVVGHDGRYSMSAVPARRSVTSGPAVSASKP